MAEVLYINTLHCDYVGDGIYFKDEVINNVKVRIYLHVNTPTKQQIDEMEENMKKYGFKNTNYGYTFKRM